MLRGDPGSKDRGSISMRCLFGPGRLLSKVSVRSRYASLSTASVAALVQFAISASQCDNPSSQRLMTCASNDNTITFTNKQSRQQRNESERERER